jgi:hypothetical protein
MLRVFFNTIILYPNQEWNYKFVSGAEINKYKNTKINFQIS